METAVNTTMSTAIFNSLVTKLKPSEDSSLSECAALEAHHGSYSIEMYKWEGDDLSFDAFGYMTCTKKWVQLEPTTEQLSLLEQKMKQEIDRLQEEKSLEELNDERWYQDNKNYDVRAEQGLYSYGY